MVSPAEFWRGEGGDSYLARNRVDYELRIPFWRKILALTQARTVLEVGCNRGHNLTAIQQIDRSVSCMGIDLNLAAVKEANAAGVDAREASATEAGVIWPARFDVAATCGMLIHVPPDALVATMLSIRRASRRWVLAVEYAADKEEPIEYRGESGLLWRRPFGQIYCEEIGMRLREQFDAGEGFDRCTAWLLEK